MTRHLVISVHGIGTLGTWQENLREMILAAEPGAIVHSYKFGAVSGYSLVPDRRERRVARFAAELTHQFEREPWDRIDIVAHSFGTFIVAEALRRLAARVRVPRIHTLLLAGSVLTSDYPWREIVPTIVSRVVNDCGSLDPVLWIPEMILPGLGFGGRIGFTGMTGHDLHNRFFLFGHSGFSSPEFMQQWWLPLLTGNVAVVGNDDRRRRTFPTLRAWLERQVSALRILLWVTIVGLPTAMVMQHVAALRQLNRELQANSWALQSLQKRDTSPIEAKRLAIASAAIAHSPRVQHALMQSLAVSAMPIATIPTRAELRKGFAVEPGGARIAELALDGSGAFVRLYRFNGGQPVQQSVLSVPGPGCSQRYPDEIGFSRTGRYLTLKGFDGMCILNVWTLQWSDFPGRERVSFIADDSAFYASRSTSAISAGTPQALLMLFAGEQSEAVDVPAAGWLRDMTIAGRDGVLIADSRGRVSLVPARGEPAKHLVALNDVSDIQVVAASNKAHSLAVGTESGAVVVTDGDGVEEIWRTSLQSAPIRLTFSPSGKQLAALLADGTARVWSAEDGAQLASVDGAGYPLDLHFVAGAEDRIITVSRDAGIKIWSVPLQAIVARVPTPVEHDAYGFDAGGKQIIAADADGGATLWSTSWRSDEPTLHLNEGIHAYVTSADGRFVAALGINQRLKLWETTSGAVRIDIPRVSPVRDARPSSIAVSEDGSTVAAASQRDVHVWRVGKEHPFELRLPRIFADIAVEQPDGVALLRWLPEDVDARLIENCATDVPIILPAPTARVGHVRRICRTDKERSAGSFATDTWFMPTPLALSRNGRLLATAVLDDVLLFDVASGELISRLPLGYETRSHFLTVPGNRVGAALVKWLAFSNDDAELIVATKASMHPLGDEGGNVVRAWSLRRTGNAKPRTLIIDQSHLELSFVAATNGVMSLSERRTMLNVWNLKRPGQRHSLSMGRFIERVIMPAWRPQSLVVLSREMSSVGSAGSGAPIHVDILDARTLSRAAHVVLSQPVNVVALTPDGEQLLVADGAGNIRTVDLRTGASLAEFALGTVPKALWFRFDGALSFTGGGFRKYQNSLVNESYIGTVVWQGGELVRRLCSTLRPAERDFAEWAEHADAKIDCES